MANSSKITFECKVCSNRNYHSTKNKRTKPGKLEFRKYCPKCRTHTLHRETK